MQLIRQKIGVVRSRQQNQWSLKWTAWGLVAGGFLGCVIAVFWWQQVISSGAKPLFFAALTGGPALGFLFSWLSARSLRDAATAIDRTYELKDRVSTALAFLSRYQL